MYIQEPYHNLLKKQIILRYKMKSRRYSIFIKQRKKNYGNFLKNKKLKDKIPNPGLAPHFTNYMSFFT